jgi:hypothetical protein
MRNPKLVAALSLLDRAGIAHRPLDDDIVEVDSRFILYVSTGFWREHFGIRHGYSVGELVTAAKRNVS